MRLLTTVTIATVALGTASEAANKQKLPANAKPLDPAAVEKIYSDQTIDYPNTVKYYYSPDHSIMGKDDYGGKARGSWSVKGHTMCTFTRWRFAHHFHQVRRFHYCYSWYTDGAAYWEMVTKATEKNLIGQVFKGDASKAHSGDQLK